jgi:anti-sigma-K factor RskA
LRERSGADVADHAQISAALVSDYVAGRLEDRMARQIETAARRDPELSRAIADARAVRRRVKERLAGPRQ